MCIKPVIPTDHLILCCPLLLPSSLFPRIRVFSNGSVLLIRWPKYWNFTFSISPSNEYLGLISFRMDRLDLLAVQGTLENLLQHHNSKAPILQRSAFFMVSPPYMTTGKNRSFNYMDLCQQYLLFNMLSKLIKAFLPRSKHCLLHDSSHHLQ